MSNARSRRNRFLELLLAKHGGDPDAQISHQQGLPSKGRHRGEWLLAAEQEPPMGSHLVTQRSGYLHHGIYVGGGQVVHYAGFVHRIRRGPVEEVSLSRFGRGGPIWVRSTARPNFDAREVIARARSRVGENCYRLLSNNCEHFCEWCLHGKPRSYQIEALLAGPARTLRATLRLIARSPSGERAVTHWPR